MFTAYSGGMVASNSSNAIARVRETERIIAVHYTKHVVVHGLSTVLSLYGHGGEPSGEMAEAGTNLRKSQHTRKTRHCRREA